MNYQLLIVDDEYEIRTGLANYIPWNTLGFQVAGQCQNGKEALDFIAANTIHAVLCDIRMPIIDGLELAKELYSQKSTVKIVFLTGYKDFEYIQQALRYRAFDYVLKPTKFEQISEIFGKIRHELDQEYGIDIQERKEPADIINAIKKIVKEHLADVTLESVSKKIYMNPFYISKLFKQKTGINFTDYVTDCRMKKAADLLNDYNYRIYDISEIIGYSNPKNFARTFKQYYGVTPSEYRAGGLTKGEASSDETSI